MRKDIEPQASILALAAEKSRKVKSFGVGKEWGKMPGKH